MFTQAQIEYIQKQRSRGLNDDAIKNKLLDAGWDEGDIKDGFKEVEKITPKEEIKQEIKEETKEAPHEEPKVESTPPALSFEQEMIVPKKKSHIVLVMILVGAVLVIAGGGAFAYYKLVYSAIKPGDQIIETNYPTDASTTTEEMGVSEIPPLTEIASTTGTEVVTGSDSATGTPPINNMLPQSTSTKKITDCVSDIMCFTKAADECNPAKVKITIDSELPFSTGRIKAVYLFDVINIKGTTCSVRTKVLEYSMKYSDDAVKGIIGTGKTQEDVKKMEDDTNALAIGSGQVCSIPPPKKVGTAFKESFESTKVSITADPTSDVKYDSGLVCKQFSKI